MEKSCPKDNSIAMRLGIRMDSGVKGKTIIHLVLWGLSIFLFLSCGYKCRDTKLFIMDMYFNDGSIDRLSPCRTKIKCYKDGKPIELNLRQVKVVLVKDNCAITKEGERLKLANDFDFLPVVAADKEEVSYETERGKGVIYTAQRDIYGQKALKLSEMYLFSADEKEFLRYKKIIRAEKFVSMPMIGRGSVKVPVSIGGERKEWNMIKMDVVDKNKEKIFNVPVELKWEKMKCLSCPDKYIVRIYINGNMIYSDLNVENEGLQEGKHVFFNGQLLRVLVMRNSDPDEIILKAAAYAISFSNEETRMLFQEVYSDKKCNGCDFKPEILKREKGISVEQEMEYMFGR